jgi:hypothetical protein
MSDASLDPTPRELSDIAMLGEDPSPLARVIYHMATRQLAMSERMSVTQSEVISIAGSVRRIHQKQAAVIAALEERGIHVANGSSSSSSMHAIPSLAGIEDV